MKYFKFIILLLCSVTLTFAQSTTNYGTNSGTQGNYSSFFGNSAGKNNTADFNTFLGFQAGVFNTTGNQNVFIGYDTGAHNTTSFGNTFIGTYAGFNNTAGNNVFVGFRAGRDNTTGGSNTFVGTQAGRNNISGILNLFLGSSAGSNNTSGRENTFLGTSSGYNNTLGSRNVFLGYNAGFNETGSNKLYIENSNTTTPLIYGDFATDQLGINTNTIPTGYTMAVNGKMIGEELKIQLVANWPDFVFNKDYNLPTLTEVEKHILENGYLRDVPNAKEVSENGILLGEMNAKLLQKIEELTLYTIQQEKEIQQQKEINKNLEKRLQKIEALLTQNQSN